jgi:hypothetical protein
VLGWHRHDGGEEGGVEKGGVRRVSVRWERRNLRGPFIL